jgi:cyclopropane-fatty-acyl-phospholipid synthase
MRAGLQATSAKQPAGWMVQLEERLVLGRLAGLREGLLEFRHADGSTETFGQPAADGLRATVEVRDSRLWRALLSSGSVGAGEAYGAGWWDSPDPVAVVRIFARNQEALSGLDSGLAKLALPMLKLFHARRRNTRSGARRNIAAHYDLSNDFFGLWLDPTMSYSCGIYESAAASLEEASRAKIDRLCRKLELRPGERLLEIGSGWGGLAMHAAARYGVHVTTATISTAQHELATRRVREAGLQDRVEVVLRDYRDIHGRFDKLVSVEMIEAVGAEYYDDFFRVLGERLEPHGLAAVQAITIADQRYEGARREVDFIQRHIFPGTCIPSVTALLASATRASDLRLVHLEDITAHYPPTLLAWRHAFQAAESDLERLGFDREFRRLWKFYFCYCAGGFLERHIGAAHLLFARSGWRSATPVVLSA